ncbi:MAG: thiolase family protein [Deltaproteobacteria bacterium]|nr:thiolase family protein [Deltaproteobacteria bacterium]MBW2086772.1 thiolase family protein [Deltaproteobacteria bacterium]
MAGPNRGKVAFIGYGEIPTGKYPERTSVQQAIQVSLMAMKTANLEASAIDTIITTRSFADEVYDWGIGLFGEEIGLRTDLEFQMFTGGASSSAMIKVAIGLILSGQSQYVLMVASNKWGTITRGKAVDKLAALHHEDWERPFGFFQIGAVALMMKPLFLRGVVTPEQSASVAVSNRKWAAMNPNAMYRDPITIEDVLNSGFVADPIHTLESPPLADGAAALLMTSAENAKNLVDQPVYLLGAGSSFSFSNISQARMGGGQRIGQGLAADVAYEEAGVGPKDIDLASIYEPYPVGTLAWLHNLGLCEGGLQGAAQWMLEGGGAPGGELPVTTDGGMLSRGHCAISGGMLFAVEAIRQLRGEVGERQVKNPQIALATAMGGVGNSAFVEIFGVNP